MANNICEAWYRYITWFCKRVRQSHISGYIYNIIWLHALQISRHFYLIPFFFSVWSCFKQLRSLPTLLYRGCFYFPLYYKKKTRNSIQETLHDCVFNTDFCCCCCCCLLTILTLIRIFTISRPIYALYIPYKYIKKLLRRRYIYIRKPYKYIVSNTALSRELHTLKLLPNFFFFLGKYELTFFIINFFFTLQRLKRGLVQDMRYQE